MSFNQMLKHPQNQGHLRYPVAIIPKAYHSSYITGDVSAAVNASDLKPEIPNEEVWKICAKLIESFVDVQLHSSQLETKRSAKFLKDYVYNKTYPLMKPLLDAFALEGNPYLYNASLINSTKWIINNIFDEMNISAHTFPTQIETQELGLIQFTLTRPAAIMLGNTLKYSTYTHKYIDTPDTDNVTNIPYQSAKWIATKYKSAEFIHKIMSMPNTKSQITCKSLNQRAIDKVLETIPPKTLERYQKYGVKLVVGEDIIVSDDARWHLAKGRYDDVIEAMYFASPRLLSGLDASRTAGDFYCKLLSPARVAEWIYVDSLRRFYGAASNETIPIDIERDHTNLLVY